MKLSMAPPQIIILVFLATLFLLPAVFGYRTNDVRPWCSKTPNPQPCEYFLSSDPKNTPIKDEPDFLRISMQLTLERATHAKSNTYSLGSKCRNEREMAAWADCIKLHELTILRLNKTVESITKLSKDDAQTWLSTALTNLNTCRTGFIELGASDYLLPKKSNANV